MIAQGTPHELVASMGADQIVEFRTADDLTPEEADRFARLPGITGRSPSDGSTVLTVSDIGSALPALLAELAQRNLGIIELTTHQPTLEDVFVSLTGRHLRED